MNHFICVFHDAHKYQSFVNFSEIVMIIVLLKINHDRYLSTLLF